MLDVLNKDPVCQGERGKFSQNFGPIRPPSGILMENEALRTFLNRYNFISSTCFMHLAGPSRKNAHACWASCTS